MNNEQTMTIEAVVCPEDFTPIKATVLPSQTNRYQTEFRTYLGYCQKCNCGWEVIQFKREGRWVIHKYQKYLIKQVGSDGCSFVSPMKELPPIRQCGPSGKWIQLNELPEPAPVIMGPGGEYDEGFTPETSELLVNLQKAFNAVNQAIKCLIRHFQK
jgi:hypothetical protein